MDGLIDAWLLDGRGGGRQLDWKGILENRPSGPEWLWVHLDYTAPDAQQWMKERSGLNELTTESLLQAETRPRCVPAEDGLMVFLRGVNLNPGADREDMVSVRLWAGSRLVVSLRKRRLLSIDEIRSQMKQGMGPETPGDFLVMLVENLLDRVGVVIDDVYDMVDRLEDELLVSTKQRQREQLAEARREAIALRRYLAPQREALNRLATERTSVLDDQNRIYLRENSDRLTRLLEDLDSARERAAVAQETLLSRLAEQTNTRMYLLSIIAAIFLPLSFVTGLLGINVGGIPGADSEFGFPVVVLLSAVIGAGLMLFFRWRRWF